MRGDVDGVWPREAPRATESLAEWRVWEALRRGLPAGWSAWHSLRLRDSLGIDGEGDFVIAAPGRGLLVLEVKGGRVEVVDGRWLQNGRPMPRAPRDQGLSFATKLVAKLRQRGVEPPAWGVATAFPDITLGSGPSGADVEDAVLGANELTWLDRCLPDLLDRTLPPARETPDRWIAMVHELWGETWQPRLRLGQRARVDGEERLRAHAEQLEVLDMIAGNDRLRIDGVAGSGKTLLVCEVARRWASAGQRVLLVSFTDALAQWLRSSLDAADASDPVALVNAGAAPIAVATVRKLARALGSVAGLELDEGSPSFWEELPWRAATDGLRALGRTWDAVVVDEAQDFALGDWALVEAATGSAKLWAFADAAQAFWSDREIPAHLFQARFKLPRNYRCPRALWAVAESFAGRPLDEAALHEAVALGELGVVACPSETSVPDKVIAELERLLGDGLRLSDIAIVSLRGQGVADSVVRRDRLGRHALVRADDPRIETHVVADTFLRFKGLERPAVIVTDLRSVADRADVRMHVALTRATTCARIVATRDALAASPVWSRV